MQLILSTSNAVLFDLCGPGRCFSLTNVFWDFHKSVLSMYICKLVLWGELKLGLTYLTRHIDDITLKNNFTYFIFGCAGSSLLRGLFSSCWKQELLSSCGMHASHCSGLSCCGARALGLLGFSSCGSRAWLFLGTWNFPGLGIKPVSPALAGGFLTTRPPGKPYFKLLKNSGGPVKG